MDAKEASRRQSHRDAVAAWFTAHPREWVSTERLEKLGGRNAWRTRVSECRTQLGMRIENSLAYGPDKSVLSFYRFVPHVPLGRDAGDVIDQQTLFDLR